MARSRFFQAITLCALALAPACAKEIPDPDGAVVDFSSPKSVVAQMFWAARVGNTDKLASLCAPDGRGNAAVKRVCAVTTAATPEWESFRANFAMGTLNGEPRVSGDSAIQKFLFGPDGAKPETMKLIREDGRWYLESF